MRLLSSIALVALAVALALLSSMYERFGPDDGVYCAIGKVDGVEVYCPEPKLNGGWPAPSLFDNPGISVERQLGFFEDDFRTAPFAADMAFYLLLLLGLKKVWTRIRRVE